jgi:membrane protein DedA with SNARE-associated domain
MHRYDLLVIKALAHLSHLSYPEILIAILASGHPLPLPEGVIFFALGLLASRGVHTLIGIFLISALACFVYDVVLYTLAYGGSKLVTKLSKEAQKAWVDRYSGKGDGQMLFLTFVSHFVPGWRMANPVIMAGLHVPPKKFVLYSILPALVYPPIYILAGFFLARI